MIKTVGKQRFVFLLFFCWLWDWIGLGLHADLGYLVVAWNFTCDFETLTCDFGVFTCDIYLLTCGFLLHGILLAVLRRL